MQTHTYVRTQSPNYNFTIFHSFCILLITLPTHSMVFASRSLITHLDNNEEKKQLIFKSLEISTHKIKPKLYFPISHISKK